MTCPPVITSQQKLPNLDGMTKFTLYPTPSRRTEHRDLQVPNKTTMIRGIVSHFLQPPATSYVTDEGQGENAVLIACTPEKLPREIDSLDGIATGKHDSLSAWEMHDISL